MSSALRAEAPWLPDRVERGVVKVGDEVEIVGLHHEPKKVVVTGLEMFHKLLDYANPAMPSVFC